MNTIKLHFPNATHLAALINDKQFQSDIQYLNPNKLDYNNIELFDPINKHSLLDTEEVAVLPKFIYGIQRIIFPNTGQNVNFFNPILGQRKYGLIHENIIICTVVELFLLLLPTFLPLLLNVFIVNIPINLKALEMIIFFAYCK